MSSNTRKDLANAIRALSMDAIQKANSGHPGMPMGMADLAEVLWNDFLQHNPSNPGWWNRDRFVVSNGHGSMLLYSLLHLTGYDLPMEQIKSFRQLHSITPGHPEYGLTPGVETTTGPLGQGLANAVGMALAEKLLGHQYNRPDHTIIDHSTYVFVGDGCIMEGISHEVCSLAGTHKLGKLIVLYDDNEISIDGDVKNWLTDDTPGRFEAYQWHVVPKVDGHDPQAIKAAIEEAKAVTDKPSLLCCQTVIGFGSPNLAGTSKTHGSPLGDDEIEATKANIGWKYGPFDIPQSVYDDWDAKAKGAERESAWQIQWAAYQRAYPELAVELKRRMAGALPEEWAERSATLIQEFQERADNIATRKSSLHALNAFGPMLPEMIGGSADLTGSNLTLWNDSKALTLDHPTGNYIYFGVREFGMSAMANGMALYGGFLPYVGTFLVFSDYARNAVRLSALMKTRVVYVFTHDSIGLGEDGPTHQPVEHLEALRLIPGMTLWRPCDLAETAVAWKAAIEHDGPTCLALTRQGVPQNLRSSDVLTDVAKGGYTLVDCDGAPEAILIATGSEVELAVNAATQLQAEGRKIRVVSMPCREIFDAQPVDYRDQVLPPHVTARVAIEAGVPHVWRGYTGPQGRVIGIDSFGESAPAPEVFAYFGLTVENIIKVTKEMI